MFNRYGAFGGKFFDFLRTVLFPVGDIWVIADTKRTALLVYALMIASERSVRRWERGREKVILQ